MMHVIHVGMVACFAGYFGAKLFRRDLTWFFILYLFSSINIKVAGMVLYVHTAEIVAGFTCGLIEIIMLWNCLIFVRRMRTLLPEGPASF